MSNYEIGKDIEALNQRISNLEDQLQFSNNDDCNCGESEEILEIPPVPEKGIRLQSLKISETGTTMKIISIVNKGEMDYMLAFDSNRTYIEVKDDIKYIVYIHPSSEKFKLESILTKNLMSSLGFGRCGCYKWGNWKCHSTRYDKDCIGKEKYFKGADKHCDLTCSSYVAIWYIECGKCGQPDPC
ncbi:hypothetical protein CN995_20310 [Bacillus cereus]|uniref:hypothetical protein n=1 Tax=Bacillus TaxID=1386 RepID=UPI000BF4B4DD|nr:hypothetical protein [Bacillus cereus]PEW52852.1 hypothetical protein CN443_29660 [Bacillus cereus]PGO96921.1 hypothetical protein CN995_20310 [Bacillus cereus]PGY79024.1 hypothetical protein COE36_31355 [Bacillus cereus]